MINLLYCANAKVFDGIMLSLMSCTAKTKSAITAYIMTMDLRNLNENYVPIQQKHVDILNAVIKKENKDNKAVLIDATDVFNQKMGNSPNLKTGYTPYTLLRLLACEFDLPEKILYVDADTMFNGDIAEILKYDIDNCEFAGVLDYLGKRFIRKDYINAGVLYLNIKRIKRTGLFDKAMHVCLHNEMIFPDQDAINDLVQFKLILPREFNEQHKWCKTTIIQHFAKTMSFFPVIKVINVKQWQIELVKKQLKVRAYNDVYDKFIELRKEYGKDFLEPLKVYKVPNIFQRMKYTVREIRSYVRKNGGVYR